MTSNDVTNLQDSFRKVFDSPDGQKVLEALAAWSGLFQVNVPLDIQSLAFVEGKRQIVLRVLHYLNKDFASIRQLMEKTYHG